LKENGKVVAVQFTVHVVATHFVAESCTTPKILILPVWETSPGRSLQMYNSKKEDFEQGAKKAHSKFC
jgi:hypothetical protein